MKHQLDAGSYEIIQEGSVRGYGYVVQERPGVTLQRWLFARDYVRAPRLSATFQPRTPAWSSFTDWSRHVEEKWQSGCRCAIARSTQYATVDEYRDPNEQLDGNAAIARIGLTSEQVADIFTVEGREGSSHMFEHWVLRGGYDPAATQGIRIEEPVSGVPGLNAFRSMWQGQWDNSYTYVVVDCLYYNEVPASP